MLGSDSKQEKNLYEIIGVSNKATAEEIKIAYKKLALKYHPDRNRNTPEKPNAQAKATTAFQFISHAHDVLSDSTQRKIYDDSLLTTSNPSTATKPESEPSTGYGKFFQKPNVNKPAESNASAESKQKTKNPQRRLWAEPSIQGEPACLLPNGDIITATGRQDGIFKLYDPKTSILKNTFPQQGGVDRIAVLPLGNIAVTSSSPANIRIFNPHTGVMIRQFAAVNYPYSQMMSHNDDVITIDSNHRELSLFKNVSDLLKNRVTKLSIKSDLDYIHRFLATTSQNILTAGYVALGMNEPNYLCEVYDYQLNQINKFPLLSRSFLRVIQSIDSDHIAIATHPNHIDIYQIKSGEPTIYIKTGMQAISAMAMLNSDTLLVADSNCLINAYNPQTGELINSLQTNYKVTSPDVLKTLYPMINPERDHDNKFQYRRPM